MSARLTHYNRSVSQ